MVLAAAVERSHRQIVLVGVTGIVVAGKQVIVATKRLLADQKEAADFLVARHVKGDVLAHSGLKSQFY
jgi:xanthosine utilization system XapX-like protein